ncbi:MAG: elongation factor P [Phycisphaerae bacterium]|nr:elongation factor P [Phycisphaerae bacterium]
MIKASDMKKGMVINVDGKPCQVLDYQHVKLGKGGAIYQTKFRNMIDGGTVNKRIRSEETLDQMFLDRQKYEYLYSDGRTHIFMHQETFDQIELGDDVFVDGTKYCKPNTEVEIQFLDGKPLGVSLPNSVDLEVTDTPPTIKGATATNQYKKAIMETGLEITVPPFIENGEMLRIDTRTGEYLERVKK